MRMRKSVTIMMLNVYADFCENVLAIPGHQGTQDG